MDLIAENWPALSGGLLVVLGGIYAILKVISPKTKTKVKTAAGGGGPAKTVGRNDPCPCGSGKKYKKCCMLKDQAAAS